MEVKEIDVLRWWVHSEWYYNPGREPNGIQDRFPIRDDIWKASDNEIQECFNNSRGKWYGWKNLPLQREWYKVQAILSKDDIRGWKGWPKTYNYLEGTQPPIEFILIENDKGVKTVLDGNHRLSVWWNSSPGPYSCTYYLCKTIGTIPEGKGEYQ